MIVELEENDLLLSEFEYKANRDKEWEKNLKKFSKYLFGSLEFSSSCEILNPWVIEFEYKANKTKNGKRI